ncbi:GTPase ObgE [Candidatus Gottesmanbacteria bacterium]|nr:GTPase ObgE [Candidatus Gottesmanbacteria bacterium]
MIVDEITLIVKAGNGGDGASTFERNARTDRGGPNGGNGGNGGSIYFQFSTNIYDLKEFRYKKKVVASDGAPGGNHMTHGKYGRNIIVDLPLGTRITDLDTHETKEINNLTQPILVARGGKGGRGNVEFKSATNQTPLHGEKGAPGEKKRLFLELKLIADIGLIGLPNSGKSSLLSILTNAKPKIGNFPFTTVEPYIGMMGKLGIADIPGLIKGASLGKGLGTKFLKHIEKTKILIHCIDVTNEHPEEVYDTVRSEFKAFDPTFLDKPEIVLLTKTDLVQTEAVKKSLSLFQSLGKHTLTCSIYDDKSISALKQTLTKLT